MEMRANNIKLLKYLIFIVVVVLVLIALLLFKIIQNTENISKMVEEKITLAEWPEEIPVLKKQLLSVQKYGTAPDLAWKLDIDSGVSYTEFVNYLCELDKVGFEPIKEMGSKNPHLLISNPTMTEDFFIIWYGKTEDYKIDVSWKNIEKKFEQDGVRKQPVFQVFLKTISDNSVNVFQSGESQNFETGKETLIPSGEINFSGDESLISGESLSGDIEIINSGEEA